MFMMDLNGQVGIRSHFLDPSRGLVNKVFALGMLIREEPVGLRREDFDDAFTSF